MSSFVGAGLLVLKGWKSRNMQPLARSASLDMARSWFYARDADILADEHLIKKALDEFLIRLPVVR